MLHHVGVEVHRDALPPGLGSSILLLDGRRDPSRFGADDEVPRDRPIWLSLEPGPSPARVHIVASYPINTVQAHGREPPEAKRNEVLARLSRLFPFMNEGEPEVFVPGSTPDSPRSLPHPHFDDDLDPLAGIGGIPLRTPMKNLILAGPSHLPGLGYEGDFLTALQASNAAETLLSGRKAKASLTEA
ncbi:MAG: hypothetical protein HC923_05435 [Myxococcales bacterium]|nr:hypothetical protein [Myxococcales bacterium]